MMTFDNGIPLYDRLFDEPMAEARAVNTEYTAQEAETTKVSVELRVIGGAVRVDGMQSCTLVKQGLIKATCTLFSHLFVNGNSSSTETGFDGLKKLLSGQVSEVPTTVDLSTIATIDRSCETFLDEIFSWLGKLNGQPDALIMNRKMRWRMQAVAARAKSLAHSEDSFGRHVPTFDGIPIIDLGNKRDTSTPIVEITSGSKTDIYAVRFGLDAVHSISPREDDRRDNGVFIRTCMPDPSDVNKVVEIEMVTALALKNVRAAGVLRGIGI